MGKIPERWRGGGTGGRGRKGVAGPVRSRRGISDIVPSSPKNSSDRPSSPNRSFTISRWLPYSPVGKRVPGTRFIAFKVPLKQNLLTSLRPSERFTTSTLLERVPNLGIVIDLTNTTRYYNKTDFTRKGVEYQKIMCPGMSIPTDDKVAEFFKIVDTFLDRHSRDDTLIGVHCTHGVNRTAYFIARYMIQRMAYSFNTVRESVERARGYNIERPNYVDHLRNCTELLPKYWTGVKGELVKETGMGAPKGPLDNREGSRKGLPHKSQETVRRTPFERHFSPPSESKVQYKYDTYPEKSEYRGEGPYRGERPEEYDGRSRGGKHGFPGEYEPSVYGYREGKVGGNIEENRPYRWEERRYDNYQSDSLREGFGRPFQAPPPPVYRNDRFAEEPKRNDYYRSREEVYESKKRMSVSPRAGSRRRVPSPKRESPFRWQERSYGRSPPPLEDRRYSPYRERFSEREYDRKRSESPRGRYRKERSPEGKHYSQEVYPRELYQPRGPSPPRRPPELSPVRSYRKEPSPYRVTEPRRRFRSPSPNAFREPIVKKYKKDKPSPSHYEEKKHFYGKSPTRDKVEDYGRGKGGPDNKREREYGRSPEGRRAHEKKEGRRSRSMEKVDFGRGYRDGERSPAPYYGGSPKPRYHGEGGFPYGPPGYKGKGIGGPPYEREPPPERYPREGEGRYFGERSYPEERGWRGEPPPNMDCRQIINQKRLFRPGDGEEYFPGPPTEPRPYLEPTHRPSPPRGGVASRLGPIPKFPKKKFPSKEATSRAPDKKKPLSARRR